MKKPYKPDFRNPIEVYTAYHRRELWGFLENLYTWSGIPDTVDIRYFNRELLHTGYAAIFTYDGEILTSAGAPHGLDKYLRDTRFTVSNPFLKSVERTIGKDCAICFNTLNYRQPEGCDLLVEIFARRLAQIDLSLDTSLKNSRAALIAVVDDAEEALKVGAALDNLYKGESAVITTAASWTPDATKIFPLKPNDSIISAELADCRKNVMAEFYEYLGIDTVAVDKKERTNLIEMQSNNQQLYINSLRMDAARERFCKDVKETFGIDINFEKNKPEEVTGDVEGMPETGTDTTA